MRKQPRIGALLLAFAMTISLLSGSAWAADASTPATAPILCTAATEASSAETIATASVTKLRGTTCSSVKRVSSTKIKVTWKKVSSATGYQIQYSTSSRFKHAKSITIKSYKATIKTISGLSKNKKYYVRVRTYKVVNKETAYSSWSRSKWAKTSTSSTSHKTSSNTVYCTSSGKCYHRKNCPTLKRSHNIKSISKSAAKARGLKPCKVCKP